MKDYVLIKKLRDLCEGGATLLWLENSKHFQVLGIKLHENKLVLKFYDNTSKIVVFNKYSLTKYGLQFWSQEHPGVLFRWDKQGLMVA